MTALLSPLLRQLAKEFRQACQYDYRFPYDIEHAILTAFPLSIVKFSKPGVHDIQEWLTTRGVSIAGIIGPNRPIFGCTVLYRGRGFIFIDGTVNEAELRFTLAHELAHYLRDYYHPRKVAIERMGPEILEVLDDERPPRDDERIGAILDGVTLSVYTHLMERGPDGSMVRDMTNRLEADADHLALEILAPYESVLHVADIQPHTIEREALNERLHGALIHVFGLPRAIASQYSSRLARTFGREPSMREWLGL